MKKKNQKIQKIVDASEELNLELNDVRGGTKQATVKCATGYIEDDGQLYCVSGKQIAQ